MHEKLVTAPGDNYQDTIREAGGMRPGDQRVLAYLSRVGEATVSSASVIAEQLQLPIATVEESLRRLASDGLVSPHGRDTVLWMSRQQSG